MSRGVEWPFPQLQWSIWDQNRSIGSDRLSIIYRSIGDQKVTVIHASRLVVPATQMDPLSPRTALLSEKIDQIDRLASIRRAPRNFFELSGPDYPFLSSFRKASCLVAKSPAVDTHTNRRKKFFWLPFHRSAALRAALQKVS